MSTLLEKFNRLGFILLILSLTTCTSKRTRLDSFIDAQEKKEVTKSVFNQAELDFWAGVYEPSLDDLQEMRQSWFEYSGSFPESKSFLEVEQEVRKSAQKVVLVSLFSTNYEIADLRDKSLGWSMSPTPISIVELSENDVVLRALMPVKNAWARFFLVRVGLSQWNAAQSVVISNKTSRLEFPKQ